MSLVVGWHGQTCLSMPPCRPAKKSLKALIQTLTLKVLQITGVDDVGMMKKKIFFICEPIPFPLSGTSNIKS